MAVIAAVIAVGGATARSGRTPILLGADSVEYGGGTPPNCYGPSILFDYGQPGVRTLVGQQLAAMQASGLASLRVFFTYDWDASENPYFVSAAPGRLIEPLPHQPHQLPLGHPRGGLSARNPRLRSARLGRSCAGLAEQRLRPRGLRRDLVADP
jgi:hypothetical protein